jgi:hypothetical protein
MDQAAWLRAPKYPNPPVPPPKWPCPDPIAAETRKSIRLDSSLKPLIQRLGKIKTLRLPS